MFGLGVYNISCLEPDQMLYGGGIQHRSYCYLRVEKAIRVWLLLLVNSRAQLKSSGSRRASDLPKKELQGIFVPDLTLRLFLGNVVLVGTCSARLQYVERGILVSAWFRSSNGLEQATNKRKCYRFESCRNHLEKTGKTGVIEPKRQGLPVL